MSDRLSSASTIFVPGTKLRYRALVAVSGVNTFRLNAQAIKEGEIAVSRTILAAKNHRIHLDPAVINSFQPEGIDCDSEVEIKLEVNPHYCASLINKPYGLIQEAYYAISPADLSNVNRRGFTFRGAKHWRLFTETQPRSPTSEYSNVSMW